MSQTLATPKRRGRQGPVRPVETTSTSKRSIHLTDEASRRLALHALATGESRSKIVTDLINAHLRRYVMSDRSSVSAASPDPIATVQPGDLVEGLPTLVETSPVGNELASTEAGGEPDREAEPVKRRVNRA